MFQKLVNRNDDIRRLLERGYAIAIDSGHLVVRDIPYLDKEKQLQIGAFVSKLEYVDETLVKQQNHQVFFSGSTPHGLDGKPIPNLGNSAASVKLSDACDDILVQRAFSNKPKKEGKFKDFFEKIESYCSIISGPATEIHGKSPLTFRAVKEIVPHSVFKYHDTLTSRAEISDLSDKLSNDVIAIIGTGGTGAYILDFMAKTPVKEIRFFDGDSFHVHTAFRSPGKLEPSDLGRPKVDVYESRYKAFRNGINGIAEFVDRSSAEKLEGVTFAFVSVDKGEPRSEIFDLLISKGIPFIDVGMGLARKNNRLGGMLRMTYFSKENALQLKERRLAPLSDDQNNEYKNNIQIAELNALNACLAVVKFKQLRGFYSDEDKLFHLLFDVSDLKIVGESYDNEN